jgi:hypothetical protein
MSNTETVRLLCGALDNLAAAQEQDGNSVYLFELIQEAKDATKTALKDAVVDLDIGPKVAAGPRPYGPDNLPF